MDKTQHVCDAIEEYLLKKGFEILSGIDRQELYDKVDAVLEEKHEKQKTVVKIKTPKLKRHANNKKKERKIIDGKKYDFHRYFMDHNDEYKKFYSDLLWSLFSYFEISFENEMNYINITGFNTKHFDTYVKLKINKERPKYAI